MAKKRLEREGKFMETYNASVINKDDNWFLVLSISGGDLSIPLTQDEPLAIKSVFNQLILKLKEKEFKFNFQDTGNDLFTQIAKEYIKQLNTELSSVHKELSDYDLTR